MNLVQYLSGMVSRIKRNRKFKQQFAQFDRLSHGKGSRLRLDWAERYPCLDDATSETGFDRHYIYFPAWAARIISETKPGKHIDISSTLNFCAIASAFLPVEFFDYRPAPLFLPGLKTSSADLTKLDWPDASVESLSCMHVIEHVGLGRYGDPIDPDGDLKAISELTRVLAPGGSLLVAVPVGRERICFNAHRIYDAEVFASYFPGLQLIDFALIPDGEVPEGLVRKNAFQLAGQQSYGCGCYWFKRPE